MWRSISNRDRNKDPRPQWPIEVRGLVPIAPVPSHLEVRQPLTAEWIGAVLASEGFAEACRYFDGYPKYSFMSNHSRALLYHLIRMTKPEAVAEIGTLFAGTTEVMARALWENGRGVVLTTDPFGGERAQAAIAQWPKPLQDVTRFHGDYSMPFFGKVEQARIQLDLVLVDGNHDFEFAFFDLSMAARLLRPGGVVIMDNAEQSGPFYATQQFLAHNPGWHEVGGAMAGFDRSRPFDPLRSSVPETTFLILSAPDRQVVHAVPRSWGQQAIAASRVHGFAFALSPQSREGRMHFQAILRAFGEGNREVEEYKEIGSLPLELRGAERAIEHRFERPLVSLLHEREGVKHTLELELSWQAASGEGALELVDPPRPLV